MSRWWKGKWIGSEPCPALPCPALLCPDLPCPVLPCPRLGTHPTAPQCPRPYQHQPPWSGSRKPETPRAPIGGGSGAAQSALVKSESADERLSWVASHVGEANDGGRVKGGALCFRCCELVSSSCGKREVRSTNVCCGRWESDHGWRSGSTGAFCAFCRSEMRGACRGRCLSTEKWAFWRGVRGW